MFRLRLKLASLTLGFLTSFAPVDLVHAGWQLTFVDEFNGPQLDYTKWRNTDFWGLHNLITENEDSCDVDANVSVSNGTIKITARNEFPPGCNPDPGYLQYTTGMIGTVPYSFDFKYGYFEAKAKPAKGAGLASMLRLSVPGGAFPPRPPQVRVYVDGAYPTRAIFEYKYIDQSQSVITDKKIVERYEDLTFDFHRYGVDWQAGKLIYYIDNQEVARFESSMVASVPMYISVRFPVGNDAVGNPDQTTVFPAVFEIDHVAVYQRVSNSLPDNVPPRLETLPPYVAITAPFNGQKLKHTPVQFTLQAYATDPSGIRRVTFSIDDAFVCVAQLTQSNVYTCPYVFEGKDKKVNVTATAFDEWANTATDRNVISYK